MASGLMVMAQGGPSATATSRHAGSRAVLAAKKQPVAPAIAAVSAPACGNNVDVWCMWSGTEATGTQFGPKSGSIANLGNYSWRNLDESVENSAEPYGVYLRLYYSPNYGGAWVCLNVGTYIQNTGNHSFNNGPNLAGYGATLYRNVASVSFTDSVCTNPTG
ncbi:MAG TPA: hypothetical protein VIF35_09670 [Streptosporangiaceae bacterium]|jgi:hypothetical protein